MDVRILCIPVNLGDVLLDMCINGVYICVGMHQHACMYTARMHVCMYIYVCMYVCMNISTGLYAYSCVSETVRRRHGY